MTWLERVLFVLGWGLVVAAGWMKAGDDAGPGVLLTMLLAGVMLVIGATAVGMRDAAE
jgi:hypothetical protein